MHSSVKQQSALETPPTRSGARAVSPCTDICEIGDQRSRTAETSLGCIQRIENRHGIRRRQLLAGQHIHRVGISQLRSASNERRTHEVIIMTPIGPALVLAHHDATLPAHTAWKLLGQRSFKRPLRLSTTMVCRDPPDQPHQDQQQHNAHVGNVWATPDNAGLHSSLRAHTHFRARASTRHASQPTANARSLPGERALIARQEHFAELRHSHCDVPVLPILIRCADPGPRIRADHLTATIDKGTT